MTTTIPTPQQLLTRAADILDERGWHQGGFISEQGSVCAIGAVRVALGESIGLPPDALVSAVHRPYEISLELRKVSYAAADKLDGAIPNGSSIIQWNDAEGRTKEEVQAVMRRAAEAGES